VRRLRLPAERCAFGGLRQELEAPVEPLLCALQIGELTFELGLKGFAQQRAEPGPGFLAARD